MSGKVTTLEDTTVPGVDNRVSTLETTVGDQTQGLVKDKNDCKADIISIQTTVGDASSGLVQEVDLAKSDIKDINEAVFTIDTGLLDKVAA